MARKKRRKKSKAQLRQERRRNAANLRYYTERSKKRQIQTLLILLVAPPAILVGAILWANAPERPFNRFTWQESLGFLLVGFGVLSLANLFFPTKDEPPDRDVW